MTVPKTMPVQNLLRYISFQVLIRQIFHQIVCRFFFISYLSPFLVSFFLLNFFIPEPLHSTSKSIQQKSGLGMNWVRQIYNIAAVFFSEIQFSSLLTLRYLLIQKSILEKKRVGLGEAKIPIISYYVRTKVCVQQNDKSYFCHLLSVCCTFNIIGVKADLQENSAHF